MGVKVQIVAVGSKGKQYMARRPKFNIVSKPLLSVHKPSTTSPVASPLLPRTALTMRQATIHFRSAALQQRGGSSWC
jgi:hypothetical protein